MYTFWDRKFHQDVTETSFRATSLVDDYSLCVLEVVFLLFWLERCFEQGILSEKETGLPLSKMGSWEFIEAIVKKISCGEGFGKVLAEGVVRAGERVGKDAQAIAEAGRPMPYGPKVFIPSALLYATEPRPPITELHEVCHPLTKWALWYTTKGAKSYVSTDVLRGIAEKFWGSEEAVDFSTYAGKALAAIKIQDRQYAKESLVMCDFAYPIFDNAGSKDHVGDPSLENRLLSAVTGREVDEEALNRVGKRIFTLNRAIHLREGRRGREDDTLPETQFIERVEPISDVFGMHNPELFLPGSGDEVVSRKGKALEKGKFEQMLDEYYELRGWDRATGFLKKETLQKLDLPEVIDSLKEKVV
jgi:aldehyde:ferredoxin oxidoreductase